MTTEELAVIRSAKRWELDTTDAARITRLLIAVARLGERERAKRKARTKR